MGTIPPSPLSSGCTMKSFVTKKNHVLLKAALYMRRNVCHHERPSTLKDGCATTGLAIWGLQIAIIGTIRSSDIPLPSRGDVVSRYGTQTLPRVRTVRLVPSQQGANNVSKTCPYNCPINDTMAWGTESSLCYQAQSPVTRFQERFASITTSLSAKDALGKT